MTQNNNPDKKQKCLFENMPVPRFFVSKKEEGYRITLANKIARRLLNMDLQNTEDQLDLEPVKAHNFIDAFIECESQNTSIEMQTFMRDGDDLTLCGFMIVPTYADNNSLDYFDVIGKVDIKDMAVLQRERDDAMSLLASIFELSEVGILVTDQNSRLVRVNDSFVRIYGWKKDDLIGTLLETLVTPDERIRIRVAHDASIQTGEGHNGEMKIIKKDGNIANVLYSSSTLELSQKRRFQVTTVMDITLRKQMEVSLRVAKEQADNANHAKSTFLANMSHELRTPLNAIIGFSELIFSEAFGPIGQDKYKEYTGDILNSAQHLLEIINEVLDMSKIEAGRIELVEHEMDLKQLINSVVRMMDSKVFDSELKIKTNCPETLPTLMADERLLRQTLINIISNAVKFSGRGEVIEVTTKLLEDGGLEIVVSDEGHGIPKEKIQHVLEPFGQVNDNAESQNERGTGLGLPLAKAMIELHGGRLELDSDIGKGTTVKLYLPKSRIIPYKDNQERE